MEWPEVNQDHLQHQGDVKGAIPGRDFLTVLLESMHRNMQEDQDDQRVRDTEQRNYRLQQSYIHSTYVSHRRSDVGHG